MATFLEILLPVVAVVVQWSVDLKGKLNYKQTYLVPPVSKRGHLPTCTIIYRNGPTPLTFYHRIIYLMAIIALSDTFQIFPFDCDMLSIT